MGKKDRPDPAAPSSKSARVAQKQAADDEKRAQTKLSLEEAEDLSWAEGAKKPSAKRVNQEAKKADLERKREEMNQLLAEEEVAQSSARSAPRNAKTATKKTRGPVSPPPEAAATGPDDENDGLLVAIRASGIDDALDALDLTQSSGGNALKIDTHPERRFAATFAIFEERRLLEMKDDGSGQGLRLGQRKERIRKEFDRSPDNPFNQLSAQYNTTKDERKEIKAGHSAKIAERLTTDD